MDYGGYSTAVNVELKALRLLVQYSFFRKRHFVSHQPSKACLAVCIARDTDDGGDLHRVVSVNSCPSWDSTD